MILAAAWPSLSFVHPLLAGGAALIVLPILIHYLSRRRYRLVEWGATLFLRRAERESRRRTQFEQWLLLALRCLAVALAALLLARPLLEPRAWAALGGGGTPRRVLILDDSASMGHQRRGQTDWMRAVDAGLRMIDAWASRTPDDRITVLCSSAPQAPLIDDAALRETSGRPALEALRQAAPTGTPGRMRDLLAGLADALRAPAAAAPAEIIILSDFQRNEWAAGEDEGSPAAAFRARPAGLARLVLVRLAPEDRENVAVRQVRLVRARPVQGQPTVVEIEVANHTARTLRDLRLVLELDGAALATALIDELAAERAKTVQTELVFPAEGAGVLAARLETGDALPADDAFRIGLEVATQLRVLAVNGDASADSRRDETHFLQNALAPSGPFGSGIEVQVIDPTDLEATPLGGFDCVFLCNLESLRESTVELLEQYVRRGGGVCVTLGEHADAAALNALAFRDGRGLLPLALGEAVALGGQEGVGMRQTQPHPVTAMFEAIGVGASEAFHFWRCIEAIESDSSHPASLSGAPPTSASTAPLHAEAHEPGPPTILARFNDAAQRVALAERRLGAGRTLLFTSTLDLEWNDWARAVDGSYVVTLLEIVQYLARRPDVPPAFRGGADLVVPQDEADGTAVVRFLPPGYPDEPPVAARPDRDARQAPVWRGPEARELGVYQFERSRQSSSVERRPLCVNLDPPESDLASATDQELDALLAGVPHTILGLEEALEVSGPGARRELWPVLVAGLAALLMVEQLLGFWFGRPRRRAAAGPARPGRSAFMVRRR